MSSTRTRHPILHVEVVASDGTWGDEYRVFCLRQRRSLRVEDCCMCAHCDAIVGGDAPVVECTIPDESKR